MLIAINFYLLEYNLIEKFALHAGGSKSMSEFSEEWDVCVQCCCLDLRLSYFRTSFSDYKISKRHHVSSLYNSDPLTNLNQNRLKRQNIMN